MDVPTSTGGPSGNPVTLISPDSAWMTTSNAPSHASGPVCP